MVAEPLVQVRCRVCGGERYRVVSTAHDVAAQLEYLRRFHRRRLRCVDGRALADRAEFTQGYATDIVQCEACGLLFRNPRPTDDAIARAYAADRYGINRLTELFGSQVELYRPKARGLRRWLRSGARVVEVGSFVGGFLQAGREQGWRMLGVDPGEEVVAFCAERELPVFRGTLPELDTRRLPDGRTEGGVDCVAIWNAFDQLADPEPTLAAARRLLRSGGLLALRVPNGACFRLGTVWTRRLPYPLAGWLRALLAWNNLLAFPYLHGYTLRTLDWLLGWHRLERIAARGDVLCRLSDEDTKPWAAWEEYGLKGLAGAAARVQGLWDQEGLGCAPWLDVYFRAI